MFRLIVIILIFLNSLIASSNIVPAFEFREDDSKNRVAMKLHPKSHINIFLPSIPYSYIAKSTNSGLIRSYDNKRGWVYDLAKSHKRVDDYTYIFTLRDNLKFQNGENFTMNDILYNLEFFKKNPFLYTNIDKIDFDIIKLDEKRFKIVLKQKYEMFLTDLARVYFYTKEYIQKYNPVGKETGTANKIAGAFGMGPYILKEGFAIGDEQTEKLELVANPYYWNKDFPKVKRVTVYTQLDVDDAIKMITKQEGKLDLMPIPFNKKLEVLLSKYSKLIVSKSTDNFVIFFNLINGNKKLKNQKVRQALNQALNQENLLNFVYKKEGKVSDFTASINYDIVNKISKKYKLNDTKLKEEKLHRLLEGLELKVFTQDRFMFLFKGIEFQLKRYGVKLIYDITTSEKDIYKQLLNTNKNKNTKQWDLLIWGDDDWYYQNPWTVFFIYETNGAWSTINKDEKMQEYIKEFFITKKDTLEYEQIVRKILFRARDMAYTLRVPSLNKVFAVNKEVIFKPYEGGIIPLWEIEITNEHWSIRGDKEYKSHLKKAIKPKRVNDEINK
ncbi:peptide ABC transporter substrate-binding protein [Malaciobacter halophilus]|uniref:Peptide ABC transporter substrate-binding protein n=1 Tax=Malaciobacter halophilus TaxID=197482 RepID=A0A2N1J4R1_9BACT|nr:ABC transporter substrate-binding protein [Malaciobacter halophilus]AXH10205.1 putative periplasmic binding protein [Malaciobacter halophilus]PKI81547.1 peptide ABC transporter substrate-binding protein [Malaciobacter halophilus]